MDPEGSQLINSTAKQRWASVALLIPALNEEPVIGPTIDRAKRAGFRHVLVADNGSTDGTVAVAEGRGVLVTREPRRGYGAACMAALRGLPECIDTVVFLQADGSEDPAEAHLLLAPILDGRADLVLGSRTLGRAAPGALLPHQRLGNRLLTGLIGLLYGHQFSDLGPFRAIRVDALRRLDMRHSNYGWTIEMQVKAVQQGLRVMEVPVTYGVRVAGETKVSGQMWPSISAGVKMFWMALRLRFHSIARPSHR
jgi:glycosyltransferase involved in cell wall biosynthesis